MKHTFSSKKIFFAVLCIFCSSAVFSQQPIPEKPRILISTDIGGTDPDDNQSIAHFMMYSDLFDKEGLVYSHSYCSVIKSELLRMIDI